MKLKQVLNMKKSSFILFIALLFTGRMSVAQDVMSLSLVDAIYIAQEHSPQAQAARQTSSTLYDVRDQRNQHNFLIRLNTTA